VEVARPAAPYFAVDGLWDGTFFFILPRYLPYSFGNMPVRLRRVCFSGVFAQMASSGMSYTCILIAARVGMGLVGLPCLLKKQQHACPDDRRFGRAPYVGSFERAD